MLFFCTLQNQSVANNDGEMRQKNRPVPRWLGIVDPQCGQNINVGEKRLAKHKSAVQLQIPK